MVTDNVLVMVDTTAFSFVVSRVERIFQVSDVKYVGRTRCKCTKSVYVSHAAHTGTLTADPASWAQRGHRAHRIRRQGRGILARSHY